MPFASGGARSERERELETLREGLAALAHGLRGTLIPTSRGLPAPDKESAGGGAGGRPSRGRGRRLFEARGSALEQPFAFGGLGAGQRPRVVISKNPWAGRSVRGRRRSCCAARWSQGERRPLGAMLALRPRCSSLYWLVVNMADQAPPAGVVNHRQWADRD